MLRHGGKIALLLALVSGALGCSGPSSVQEWLVNKTGTDSGYVLSERPKYGGHAVEITIDIAITSILSMDTIAQTLEFSGFYRQSWTDPRLAFPGTSDGGCFDAVNVPHAQLDNIWRPDLYIDNSVDESYLADMFEIYTDGSVFYSQRVILTTECAMNFARLPLDEQQCPIVVASYSQSAQEITTSFVDKKSEDYCLNNAEWTLGLSEAFDKLHYFDCCGDWSFAYKILHFKRNTAYYNNVIVLIVIFVVISFSSYFIDRKAFPARVAISVIPVLIQITQVNTVMEGIPRLDYHTFIGDFIATSSFYCAVTVFQYALVCFLMDRENLHEEKFMVVKRIAGELKKAKAMALKDSASNDLDSRIEDETSDETSQYSSLVTDEDNHEMLSHEMMQFKTDSFSGDLTGEATSKDKLAAKKVHQKKKTSLETLLTKFPTFPENEMKYLTVLDQGFLCDLIEMFDPNGDNRLDPHEVRGGFRKVGIYRSLASIVDLFERNHMNIDGISQREFLQLLESESLVHQPTLTRSLWDKPPSLQLDIFCRIFYIPIFLIICLIFLFSSDLYEDGEITFKFPDGQGNSTR